MTYKWEAIAQDLTEERDRLLKENERLTNFLHSRRQHPDFEYATTDGPRKAWDVYKPDGEGWEKNIHYNDGWERFSYHEEAYWMRRAALKSEKQ